MALTDSYQLSTVSAFQNRVQAGLLTACVAIANEGWAVAFHRERANFAVTILSGSNGGQSSYVTLFSNSVATDTNVLADATVNGTVAITSSNASTQAALVTDAHINAAISSQFNSFIREPQG